MNIFEKSVVKSMILAALVTFLLLSVWQYQLGQTRDGWRVYGFSFDRVYKPLYDYDFSVFQENSKLTAHFTEIVRKVLAMPASSEDPPWLSMRREIYSEIGYLGIKDMAVQPLKGFKSATYIGYRTTFENGDVRYSSSKNSEHYFFPMVIEFQKDGSLIVKTNGEELQFNYATDLDRLTEHFEWILYTELYRQFEQTERFRRRRSEQNSSLAKKRSEEMEKNRESWR